MSAVLTPFIGLLVDKIGKRTILLIFSSAIMTIAHIIFLLIPECPEGDCKGHILILPFVLLGIFYSFYSAVLWPCVAMVCDPEIVGTAFGIITAV